MTFERTHGLMRFGRSSDGRSCVSTEVGRRRLSWVGAHLVRGTWVGREKVKRWMERKEKEQAQHPASSLLLLLKLAL